MGASMRIGFIVNPIAGMGGRVGLKGTDGTAYLEALKRGAEPVSPGRARRFLRRLMDLGVGVFLFYTGPGPMGYDVVRSCGLRGVKVVVVGELTGGLTSAEDTKRIARLMLDRGVDLIVFVGGDGTARDLLDVVDQEVPVLGVPSGVKMYSGVFAVSPEAAADIVHAFLRGETIVAEEEVLDIDEEAFRSDRLVVRLYGYMLVPVLPGYIQSGKQLIPDTLGEVENKKAIARFIVENMEPDTLYILGPGSTVKAIADQLGVPKTLLGVDAVFNGKLVGRDLDEKGLLKLLNKYPRAKLVVTPIGGQGFILGRGNQQISPAVIRRIGGKKGVIVVATRRKLQGLKVLRVDTGDLEVDNMLRSYIKVIVDYNTMAVVKVV